MRARCVYPDGMVRMVCVLRVTTRCVARALRRRGPYNASLFNLPILPEQKMGGLKIIDFLKLKSSFVWLGQVASRGAGAKKGIYDEPPTLGIPRQHVVSMMALLCVWLFERLSPYK